MRMKPGPTSGYSRRMGTLGTSTSSVQSHVDLVARMHHAAGALPVDGVREPLPIGADLRRAAAAADEVLAILTRAAGTGSSSRWVRGARRALTGRPSELDAALHRSVDALAAVMASLN